MKLSTELLMLLTMLAPALTAALLMLDGKATASRARSLALLGALGTLLLSVAWAWEFVELVPATGERGPVHPRSRETVLRYTWLELARPAVAGQTVPPLRYEIYLGVDGIGLSLILLTTLLTVSAILVSWQTIQKGAAGFYAALLLLESSLIGVFCAYDLLLFYVFFEFTLLPLFFLVGIWGGPLRQYAAVKFFLYTLAGSVFTLVGLIALSMHGVAGGVTTPFSIPDLSAYFTEHPLPDTMQRTLFLLIAIGFLVKVPVFPFHTWLPLAHVEAPTAGSVMLAGVLLKLGSFGFLRLLIPMVPDACLATGVPLIAALSAIGIVYGSLCALAQDDIKKLVAYSSVAHLGFCMLGLFALNAEGISGGILQMINHGLSTGALFCLVGMFYDRYHSRKLSELGGLAGKLPRLGVLMVFISFASIGLPGLNGFVGEVLCLIGMFRRDPYYAAVGALGVVLGAWYLLGMLQKAFFGPLLEPGGHHHAADATAAGHGHAATAAHGDAHGHGHDHGHDHGHGHGHAAPVPAGIPGIPDLNFRELAAVLPLAALCLYLGLFPQTLLDLIRPEVKAITRLYTAPDEQVADAETQPLGSMAPRSISKTP